MPESSGYERRKELRQQFLDMAKRYEEMSLQSPEKYRARVRWFLALGHGYLYGLLVLLVGLVCLAGWLIVSVRASAASIKLALFAGIPAFAIVRSLFFKTPPHSGVRPAPEKNPKLREAIDGLVGQVGAPRVGDLVVDMQMNAFASQQPAWGLVGPPTHVVGLGLPLLLAMDRQQAESILAHELGHIAGGHTRLGARLYRTTRAWWEFVERVEDGGVVSWAAGGFFKWYMPRLDAMGFALRRIEEYEADAAALRARNRAAGISLVRLHIVDEVHDRFWRTIYSQISNQKEPPTDVFRRLGEKLKEEVDRDFAVAALKRSLEQKTSYDDTHPSLTERLRAMGLISDPPTDEQIEELAMEAARPPVESAAESLFGDLGAVFEEVDELWRETVAETWSQRHGTAKSLEAESQGETPEALAAAARRAYLIDPESSIPIHEALLEIQPDHAMANFLVGTYRVSKGDLSGLDLVEASAADKEVRENALAYLVAHFEKVGDEESAKRAYGRLEAHQQDAIAEGNAVDTLGTDSVYEASPLSISEASGLYPVLEELKPQSAYLINLCYSPDESVRLLVVDPGYKSLRMNDEVPAKFELLWSADYEFDSRTLISVLGPKSKEARTELERRGIGKIFPVSS